jgi:hypothetical protein
MQEKHEIQPVPVQNAQTPNQQPMFMTPNPHFAATSLFSQQTEQKPRLGAVSAADVTCASQCYRAWVGIACIMGLYCTSWELAHIITFLPNASFWYQAIIDMILMFRGLVMILGIVSISWLNPTFAKYARYVVTAALCA